MAKDIITTYPLLLNFIQEVKEPSFLLIELLSILTNPFEQALNINANQLNSSMQQEGAGQLSLLQS